MFGPNALMDMARSALFASQTALQVTGENISNVNTVGYSRRYVELEEGISIDYAPGQIGTGVKAVTVQRHFNDYVEKQYLEKYSMEQRWDTLETSLNGVQAMVNEANGQGISSSLTKFFVDWNDLSQRADDYGSRQTLVGDTKTLTSTIRQLDEDLNTQIARTEALIQQDVTRANKLMQDLADINKEITIHSGDRNTPNALLDKRNALMRELSGIMDIDYVDNGGGNFLVLTKAGQTLVDGDVAFSLSFDAPESRNDLEPGSTFDGTVFFEGTDHYEYTLEVVDGNTVRSDGSAAQFRVSIDGGNTWLKDDDGNTLYYFARPYENKVHVGDLDIWFGQEGDPNSTPTQNFTAGDRFTISAQRGVYWVENTSSKENITPQVFPNGEDNTRRITGGTLGAYFNYRDEYIGAYREKLDAFSEELVWQTNRLHSQGAGLQNFSYAEGTYSVADNGYALGSASSGLVYGSRLQSGTTMVYVYNQSTGLVMSNASGPLDWGDGAGIQNFDPDVHTLASAAAAFNRTYGTYMNASIISNKLILQAEEGYEFNFGTDSTGLMAALGINTFFEGSDAGTININGVVSDDLDFVAAGHVNGAGEVNPGDNTIAKAIAGLQDSKVDVTTFRDGTTSQSIVTYYNSFMGSVGTDVSTAQFNHSYSKTLADDLNRSQQEVAGVNLDEEMSNLIKYQQSYTAAAKMITTADQMIQTILGLKS